MREKRFVEEFIKDQDTRLDFNKDMINQILAINLFYPEYLPPPALLISKIINILDSYSSKHRWSVTFFMLFYFFKTARTFKRLWKR